jgi:hypothetical protein
LFKYDKRLNINCFKYISVLEEYYRSQITKINPARKFCESKKIITLGTLKDSIFSNRYNLASDGLLKEDFKKVINLRNEISHNRIVVALHEYKITIQILAKLLPTDYLDGFRREVNSCSKNLKLDEQFIVNI